MTNTKRALLSLVLLLEIAFVYFVWVQWHGDRVTFWGPIIAHEYTSSRHYLVVQLNKGKYRDVDVPLETYYTLHDGDFVQIVCYESKYLFRCDGETLEALYGRP